MQMTPDTELILLWAKKIASLLVLPPMGPLLLTAFGLWRIARRRRGGLPLALAGLTAMWLLSTPASVGWLLSGLEGPPRVGPPDATGVQAIVILAGGQRRNAPEYGGPTVNALSLERIRYGARLARRSGLPVLVSGGSLDEDIPEAELMRDALEQDFGVAVRWVEPGSRDTRENATNTARTLHAAGIQRILLVTHAAHMRRARRLFERAGLEVVPAPTARQSNGDDDLSVLDFVPTPRAAFSGWYGAHEWLGLLVDRISDP